MRRPLLPALALATVGHAAWAADCPAPGSSNVDEVIEAAVAAREQGKTDAALACLNRAYVMEQSAGIIHNIARLLEDLGKYRQAAEAYRRILRDPTIEAELREADKARLKRLELMLERAWLRASFPPSLQVLVGSDRLEPDKELDVRPGTLTLEVLEGEELHLLRVSANAGERLELTLPTRSELGDGFVALAPVAGLRLSIDGRELASSLAGVARLRVAAGAHELEWTDGDGPRREAFTVAPGATWLPGSAPSKRPRGLAWAPWVAGAAAVGLAAGGGVMLGLAESDRAEIRGAARDADGVVTGLTFVQAVALSDRSEDRTVVGAVLIGGAVASGLLALVATWMAGDAD